MQIHIVSVFMTDDPFREGNPLAVGLPQEAMSKGAMQAVAATLGFSESAFVTAVDEDSYEVRIFTPEQELGFAGHPTLGTAWTLRGAGMLRDEECRQVSRGGETRVWFDSPTVWFERSGSVEDDLEQRHPDSVRAIAAALGLGADQIGLEARELGRSGHLRPAFADAGLRQLMVPVRDLGALEQARPDGERLRDVGERGAYVFTASGAGTVRARGFWGPIGVPEDPATGSAAAALGLYLAARIEDIAFEVSQGGEIARPSRIEVVARADSVRVGGRCGRVLSGELEIPAG